MKTGCIGSWYLTEDVTCVILIYSEIFTYHYSTKWPTIINIYYIHSHLVLAGIQITYSLLHIPLQKQQIPGSHVDHNRQIVKHITYSFK